MDVRTSAPAPRTEYFPAPRGVPGPARWLELVRHEWGEMKRFWPVVQNMVVQELRVRYQRSWLGFLWTLLHPVLMMTTLTMVFSRLFDKNSDPIDYAVYLF